MNYFNNFNKKTQIILLSIMWVVVQVALTWKFGIVTNFEASKYIDEANHLIQYGNLDTANHYLYLTEIVLIAIILKLRLSFTVIVFTQLLLNILATLMFYKLAEYFLRQSFLAFCATFFFIINVNYQVYNSFLFTESVFYSLTIIYSSYLLRLERITLKNIFFLLILLALLSITRPTGILFFGATIIYVFFRFMKNISFINKAVIFIVSFSAFLIIINAMLQAGGSLDFMLPFRRENIICGVNTVYNANINALEKGNSLKGLLYFISNNYHEFAKMAALKTKAFFGMLRSYYSLPHNIYLAIFFYPFYVLALMGIWKKIKAKDVSMVYFVTIILLYWITTMLTCDDWHNRFILTVTPFLFLLGFAAFINQKKIKGYK